MRSLPYFKFKMSIEFIEAFLQIPDRIGVIPFSFASDRCSSRTVLESKVRTISNLSFCESESDLRSDVSNLTRALAQQEDLVDGLLKL